MSDNDIDPVDEVPEKPLNQISNKKSASDYGQVSSGFRVQFHEKGIDLLIIDSNHYQHNGGSLQKADDELKADLSESVWKNMDDINPTSFSALMKLWRQVSHEKKDNYKTSHGKNLWKKAKAKILQRDQKVLRLLEPVT